MIPERPTTALPPGWWTPGHTARERRADETRPDWAAFIAEALSTNVTSAPQAPEDWRATFAGVFHPLVDVVRHRLGQAAADLARVDESTLTERVAAEVGDRLVTIAVRTLVRELNRARTAGTLDGSTPEERFADFARRTGTREGLTGLFTTYPVLARLLGQLCLQAVESTVELLDRFTTDRARIAESFADGDLGTLLRVYGGAGDSHQRGRSVRLLEFSSGHKVIYKPRPLSLHTRFSGIVGWLNARVPGLELRTVDALARPGYGWLRFVEHRPCASLDDVDRFYRRQGVLLALLHALDATDVHYENVIACGDQPVLVDVETLLQPALPTPGRQPDPAADVLSRSVQRTMLLPQLLVGERGAIDVSGLGGRGGQLPSDQVRWLDAGTDRMRLGRIPGILPGALNRPRLDGRDVDPAEHTAALLSGFRTGYDTIADAHDELARLVREGGGDTIRVLIRPTNFYARILDETTHPDLLRDAQDRDGAFDLLATDSAGDLVREQLVPAEREDLWAGDVPMFTTRPTSSALWDSGGNRIDGMLASPALDAVLGKLGAMSTVDQRDQEWLISAAVASGAAEVTHRCADIVADAAPSNAPGTAQLLVTACGIADRILARAFGDERRANWLGLEVIDERYWAVLPMGAGLGEGYTGVALFLAQLAELSGIARYRDLAAQAVRPLPALLEKMRADRELADAAGCGGPLGLGGVAYAATRLTALLGDDVPAGLVEQAVAAMPAAGPDTPAEYMTGLAGGLAAMRAVHAATGLDQADRLAQRYAELLLDRGPSADAGFATGAAGIAWALAGAHHRVDFRTSGRAGFAAFWGAGRGWCGGLAGATLAHAQVGADNAVLDEAVAVLADQAPLKDMSLCHGEAGIVEALCVLAEDGHTGAAAAVRCRVGTLLAALDRHGPRCGTPGAVPSPGLLTGLAGIGYGLLRLGFAERVPSALLLRPGAANSTTERGTIDAGEQPVG
ncbi:type 2 lanthipeptide synthetase LanM family protein [Amycolatopsis sp. NPDC059027]|uniref:type 2 lanthipeptide synthetase LanM family protein n=1 Tax=unclassified Amycolatopsis TaxID=2618356 RepID=UPI00366FC883